MIRFEPYKQPNSFGYVGCLEAEDEGGVKVKVMFPAVGGQPAVFLSREAVALLPEELRGRYVAAEGDMAYESPEEGGGG